MPDLAATIEAAHDGAAKLICRQADRLSHSRHRTPFRRPGTNRSMNRIRKFGCFYLVLVSAYAASARAEDNELTARHDAIIVRAIQRMEGVNLTDDADVQAAITRHIDRTRGTQEFLPLVKQFRPRGVESALEALILESDDDSEAVEAIRLLSIDQSGVARVRRLLRSDPTADATRVARLLGLLGNRRSTNLLSELIQEPDRAFEIRAAAVRGMARNNLGAKRLLELAANGELPGDLRLLAGGLLSRSNYDDIAKRANELLPQPKLADAELLPPLGELATMRGDTANGIKLFRTKGTCSNCHIVREEGKEVGPDLSEIGSKLSREAMLTSILDPSAGISHNYESYIVLLTSGQIINGVKISETEDQVVIRTAEAIDHTLRRDQIDAMRKSDKSIMPENLHHVTGKQGLVDVVEYLMTLKKN